MADHDSTSATPMKRGLIVEGLSVERGAREVLSGFSLQVEPGESVLLMGANGAGKTTLLKTIAGLLAPAAGTIILTVGETEMPIAERAHYVGHANGIRSSLTVEENAAFWARFLGNGLESLQPALDRFGLAPLASVPAAYLSAGQRRRLGLVRLLLADRPLWLLDEPTTSLDSNAEDVLADVIDTHTAGGGLAVVATHAPMPIARSRQLTLRARAAA